MISVRQNSARFENFNTKKTLVLSKEIFIWKASRDYSPNKEKKYRLERVTVFFDCLVFVTNER